mgnify:CR=1 FL=1
MCIFQERNAFLVTNVLIPNQKGAPDSCDLLHEEELYEYADKHELLQLGWIHVRSSILSAVHSVFPRQVKVQQFKQSSGHPVFKVHFNVCNIVWVQEKVPKLGGAIVPLQILKMLVFTTCHF